MKRLTLLLLGLALGVSATAGAQGLTMQMSNGWSFSFSGNVNVFWVFSKENTTAGDATNSSVRTGLLPAFATFEARGKEAGLNLGIHFGFAPQIQNAGVHDNFGNGTQAGAQIDMRQVYLTIGLKNGSQILAGRELSLFGRQNILNDMTLFGVGAVGIGGGQGGGTTLGRIAYGYLYPNFNAQVTYSTKPGQSQLSIGVFQPNFLIGDGSVLLPQYGFTKIPRVEAEFTYNQKSGKNNYMFWVGGLWQSKSDGGYVQLTYKVGEKTTVGGSWGFSRLVNNQTGDGNTAVISNLYSYTVGVYHQWMKSLKFVLEGTEEGTNTGGSAKQTDISAGFMLFF